MGDALWEPDLSGKQQHRKIAEKLGGLNAFQVHGDGYLYGPLWFKGQVIRGDVTTGETRVVAEGFKIPAAVKFDSKGRLFVIDNKTGELVQVDIGTGAKKTVAVLRPHLDNLAIDAQDRIFVSTNGDGSIFEVDAATGNLLRVHDKEGIRRDVVTHGLASSVYIAPAGPDAVYVTEFLAGRVTRVNLATGEKQTVASGLRGPRGIAVEPDGKLLVVNVGTKELLRIDPATGAMEPVVQNLAVGLHVPPGFLPAFTLSGVAIADSGNIYLTSDIDNVIYKLSPKQARVPHSAH